MFGARLRIIGLRAAASPGIELLEYLAPGGGRPYPTDARPNDLIHWHTRVSGSSAEQAAQGLRSFRAPFISSGVVSLQDEALGYRKSLLVRDPDGHAIQLVE